MTEEQLREVVDRINAYWTTPHPKEDGDAQKHELGVVHDFDRVPADFMPDAAESERHLKWFQTQEHVDQVRAYYEDGERRSFDR